MKSEALEKPPPLLLPVAKQESDPCKMRSSLREKSESLEGRPANKFSAKYDTFHGILKRVNDMKLSGSLDSEAPSTESEKSERLSSKSRTRLGSSSVDDRFNMSAFEDESSASSITGSDVCSPYEDIPKPHFNRYSTTSLPLPPPCVRTSQSERDMSPCRESFPPPPSPLDAWTLSRQSSDGKCKSNNRRLFQYSREKAVEDSSRVFCGPDVNDNCTTYCEEGLSVEESRLPDGISECERHQLEIFFKSLKTEVFVCGSLANLYTGWKESEGNWTYRHTGAVVVILDFGDTKSRSKRKIQILLAERGTCFPLWKDTIDNLSAYRKSGTGFHTMHLSSDHRQIIGLAFDSPLEAEKLIKYIEELTSNPENINISVPGSKKKSPSKKKSQPLPPKKQISNPCLFQHVTSVAAKDKSLYMSLQTLIDNEIVKERENIS